MESSCIVDPFRNKFRELQVCGEIIAFGGVRLSGNSNMNLDGGRITNGGTPIDPGDLTTKRYVDIACGGLDYKESARITTVSNITAFKVANKVDIENALDTVSSSNIVLEIGDRVLVKDQTNQKENGIYVWDRYSGLIRSEDMDGSPGNEISGGNICFIEEGDINASTGWMVVGKGIKVIGTNNIEWTRIAGPGTGGVSSLNDLLDVTISGTAQNDALVYMSGINRWQNKSSAASYFELGAPSDSPFSSDIGISNTDTITNALRKLDNYVVTNTGTGGAGSLNELSDVTITTPSKNDALVYNVSSDIWENKSIAGSYFEVGDASDGAFSATIGILYSDTITNAIYKLDNYIDNNTVNTSDFAGIISDIAQNTSDIAGNLLLIQSNDSDIALITSDLSGVISDIATNLLSIQSNDSDIALLTSDLSGVISDTAGNLLLIQSNDSDIALLTSDVAQNTSDIAALGAGGFNSDIAQLRSDVAQNTSDIATNLLSIQSNDSDIALITSDLANVISDTAQNTSDIAALGTGGLTETVLVVDNASTPTNIVNTAQQGTFMLLVKSTSDDGAGALFTATCSNNASPGNVARLVNAPSVTNEEINITWPSTSVIRLFHSVTKTGGTGTNISYDVKIISA